MTDTIDRLVKLMCDEKTSLKTRVLIATLLLDCAYRESK